VGISVVLLMGMKLYADDASIQGLFKEIETKVVKKDYKGIEKNIYPLSNRFNVGWIVKGMKHPTKDETSDNGFNLQALKTIEVHTESFQPLAKARSYKEIKNSFLKTFKDDDPKAPFTKDLKNGGKHIYILQSPTAKSMVLLYKDKNHYKLVWWKEMVRVAKQF